jgi:hypothetical protein
MIRAIVLTSSFPRHAWVASTLAKSLDVVGVWQEQKTFMPERYAGTADDLRIIRAHFASRDAAEARDFGGDATPRLVPGAILRAVAGNGCNVSSEIARMEALRPDVALVFGTGILKAPLIQVFEGRLLNIHLGLSPYYRGAGTNFWPLVNREPEYVGATIHYIDEGIDTGPIVAHVRPEIRAGDDGHDIGNRTIMAAVAALAHVATLHVAGHLRPSTQDGPGKTYYRKDFNAGAVSRAQENFRTGMIDEYLADRARRDAALRLLDLPAV